MKAPASIHCRFAHAVVTLAMLFASCAAYARDCHVDSDCPLGWQCDLTAPDAPVAICFPIECKTDSDCAEDLSCQAFGTGCNGTDCHELHYCLPRWQGPCKTDTDCGPGFTCSGTSAVYDCSVGADASTVPPYATAVRIPCSEVPGPPMLFPCVGDASCPPFARPAPICERGTTCCRSSTSSANRFRHRLVRSTRTVHRRGHATA